MRMLKQYKFTIASAALVIALLLLPSQFLPKPRRSAIEVDKIVHALLFATVTAVFCAEHFARTRKSPLFFLTLGTVASFAILTELSQHLTRTRHFDLKDFAADVVGIVAALAISKLTSAIRSGL